MNLNKRQMIFETILIAKNSKLFIRVQLRNDGDARKHFENVL